MVWRCIGSCMIVATLFADGCTKQDVRPYFDAAISKFEDARKLESESIEEEAKLHESTFNALFDSAEKATLESLRVLLRSGWDPEAGDFKEDHRSAAWAGWFGVAPASEIPGRELLIQKSLLSQYLNETIRIDIKMTSTGTTETGQELKMYDQFTKYEGKSPGPGKEPASPSDAQRLADGYKRWVERFEADVLKMAPVYSSLAQARKSVIESVNASETRRLERNKLVYDNLIAIAQLGREQSAALTDHAGFIQLANKIFAVSQNIDPGAPNRSGSGTTRE
jgi:hypothetical protein